MTRGAAFIALLSMSHAGAVGAQQVTTRQVEDDHIVLSIEDTVRRPAWKGQDGTPMCWIGRETAEGYSCFAVSVLLLRVKGGVLFGPPQAEHPPSPYPWAAALVDTAGKEYLADLQLGKQPEGGGTVGSTWTWAFPIPATATPLAVKWIYHWNPEGDPKVVDVEITINLAGST